jgi:hypothetical protein
MPTSDNEGWLVKKSIYKVRITTPGNEYENLTRWKTKTEQELMTVFCAFWKFLKKMKGCRSYCIVTYSLFSTLFNRSSYSSVGFFLFFLLIRFSIQICNLGGRATPGLIVVFAARAPNAFVVFAAVERL